MSADSSQSGDNNVLNPNSRVNTPKQTGCVLKQWRQQTLFCAWFIHSAQARPFCSVVVVFAPTSRRHRDLCRQIAAAGADQINVHRTFYTHRPSYCNMLIMKSASHSKNWFRLYFVFVLISLIIRDSRIIRSWKSLRADEDAIYDKTRIMFKLFPMFMPPVQALNRYWKSQRRQSQQIYIMLVYSVTATSVTSCRWR